LQDQHAVHARQLSQLSRTDPRLASCAGSPITTGFTLHIEDLAMTPSPNAAAAGQFLIGGDIPVHRLGFGAMRITGKGIWGEPADPVGSRATLRELPALGVNLIDTADSYGPEVSENLIREVLHPYSGMLIATKGGLTRHGPDVWKPLGRPEYLRQCVLMSLRRLGVERIDLWQLHRIDAKVPREEQFEAIAAMQQEGLIRHVGLSEVNVEEIEAARKYFAVATVQNLYNLANRQSEAVVDHCTSEGIGFIPWYPLAAGELAGPGSVLEGVAQRLQASNGQVALAWLLKRSPVMLPIPGTSSLAHLRENVAAAGLQLSDEDYAALQAAAK
jgi:pyridoxine 4-dehydrogenase